MNSYQRRLQEIAYLKERVAQLEAMLPRHVVHQLDQDELNKRRTDAMAYMSRFIALVEPSEESSHPNGWVPSNPQYSINTYPEATGPHTTPGTRKLSKWETFLLFFRQPRFVWKAWTHKS